jgi:hypothetical protein
MGFKNRLAEQAVPVIHSGISRRVRQAKTDVGSFKTAPG